MRKFWRRKRRDKSAPVRSVSGYDAKLASIGPWHVDRDTEKRTREDRERAKAEREMLGP